MFNRWWDLLIGVLLGFIFAGLVLVVSKPRPGTGILLRPPPSPAPIIINIDGAVLAPGVYSLAVNSRVLDAVKSAGGFSEDAQVGSINLAALLEDGSHIFVPFRRDQTDPIQGTGSETYGLSETGEIVQLININQAPAELLINLPGIGPVTAEKIIAYRKEQVFNNIEDIQKVPGIGPATYENIKVYLTVGE